ncbi:G-protein coupled receptor 26 isoform 2-T2 [Thomomys bottae]
MGVSLLSNALVLLCLLHSADIRRQAPALFTLNLTCGNLLCTVVNMPLTLAGVVAQRQPAGDRLCRLAAFLDTFLAANSMLSMAALSIDRWVAVVFPLSYRAKMRLRDAALMVAYTWLHALAFPAAALALSWLGFHHLYASCTLCSRRPDERLRFAAFSAAFHALSFLLSFLVLCFTYLKVLKVARVHCKRIDVITMQTLVLLVDLHPSVRERCLEEQKRRRQRATKKISTFIGSFLLCFAPYVITSLGAIWVSNHSSFIFLGPSTISLGSRETPGKVHEHKPQLWKATPLLPSPGNQKPWVISTPGYHKPTAHGARR